MTFQLEVIVFQELDLPSLPHIQFFLIEQIFETLVVTEHLESATIQRMPQDFQCKQLDPNHEFDSLLYGA